MKLTSRVGEPFWNYSLEKQEFKQGEQLGGFTVPFHVFDCVEGLFRRFGLWQSSRGICLAGIDHKPFKMGRYTMLTKNPVLVGDSVLGQSVLYSECEYLDRYALWSCRVEYGSPPAAQGKKQEIQLLRAYTDADEQLADCLLDLLNNFFTQVLSQCGTPANGTLAIAAAIPAFEKLKNQAKTQIEQIVKNEREKLWG